MLFISHRGNLTGKRPNDENHPHYIDLAINKTYYVEVDLWVENDNFYLGHDHPQYKVSLSWLTDRKKWLFIHLKQPSVPKQFKEENLCYFFHQKDDMTVTSNGIGWLYPKYFYPPGGVAVLPEIYNPPIENLVKCIGVCSDEITYFEEIITKYLTKSTK